MTSCAACGPSTYPFYPADPTESPFCKDCDEGEYTPGEAQVPCRACARGSYIRIDDWRVRECVKCPAGTKVRTCAATGGGLGAAAVKRMEGGLPYACVRNGA
jgi:hypothetical protein